MIWLLAFLACYRLTRLITADEITRPIREQAFNRSRLLGYLVSCDWCMSIWLAPFIAIPVTVWSDNRFIFAVLFALALSAITGLLSVIEDRLDR